MRCPYNGFTQITQISAEQLSLSSAPRLQRGARILSFVTTANYALKMQKQFTLRYKRGIVAFFKHLTEITTGSPQEGSSRQGER